MNPANDNRDYSTLPTYHAVRMEATRRATEVREAEFIRTLPERRAAFFARWGACSPFDKPAATGLQRITRS